MPVACEQSQPWRVEERNIPEVPGGPSCTTSNVGCSVNAKLSAKS